ncbi:MULTISPECIES: TetR/AcrR family transcriptional regulator [Streptomyces]|uniref:TetR/AcrR family transcriptional regulator n=1 Tax=Streptomyces TaxID=1883 RepID=UPI001E4443F0|nr:MULTISPECIES: TetR/AcrR family transcriptional regulator [Streptomyces]MCZ4098421.1 TetR/AcrR family transcriptional regulator [Streptomyces sp. H39-C1]
MTAIAKQAGVGVGTLYRHFPTREALIVELYHQEIQKVIDLAHTLAASLPPLEALRHWFDEVARYGQLKYGVAEVIHAAANGGLDDENYESFLGAIAVLLAAGVAEGTLKPGTDPEDVLLQLSVLWRIPPGAGEPGTRRTHPRSRHRRPAHPSFLGMTTQAGPAI